VKKEEIILRKWN